MLDMSIQKQSLGFESSRFCANFSCCRLQSAALRLTPNRQSFVSLTDAPVHSLLFHSLSQNETVMPNTTTTNSREYRMPSTLGCLGTKT